MRAVIIAPGDGREMAPLNQRFPVPLLPLVDRPFIQCVVESLVNQGITEFDFVVGRLPEKIEQFLGDGSRWGCRFRYHLVKDPARPYRPLGMLDFKNTNESILLGHADRLPQFPLEHIRRNTTLSRPIAFCATVRSSTGTGREQWTGWAVIPAASLASFPVDADESELGLEILRSSEETCVMVPTPLSVQSPEDLLSSQSRVLLKERTDFAFDGREIEPSVWRCRNVRLHRSVKLIPPVYVGENCRIRDGVHLGPNVVVGSNCIIDARCSIRDSAIFPYSYVGEAVELSDVIVDEERVIKRRSGTVVSVQDNTLLGSLSHNDFSRGIAGVSSRVAAAAALALAWPVLAATAFLLKLFRRGPVLQKRERVRLPARAGEARWRTFELWSFCSPEQGSESGFRHFLFRLLPALVNVARGELSFVGVPPRTRMQIERLPSDWRELYLQSKPGIVTEAFVRFGASPSLDEQYSAEAWYAVAGGMRHDLKLLIGYFLNILGSVPAGRKPGAAQVQTPSPDSEEELSSTVAAGE